MPSRTNHPACPGHAAIYQLPSCWDTLCALAGHRGSVQVILGHEVKPHEWSNTTGTQLWPTFPRLATPPSIKLDNMAYFIPVLPWLLQLFYFFPVHYFLTPPLENSEWTQASSHCNTAAPQLRGRHGEKISHSATKRCKLWLSLCWSRTNLLWLQYKTSWKKEMWRSRSGRRK